MASYKLRSTCRVCDGTLKILLSLGEQYVSNFLDEADSDGEKVPLELVVCSRCDLLQLAHTAAPERMYRNYWYRSGTNMSMVSALSDIACKAETLVKLRPDDTVLDIGCNDGTLLKAYSTKGIYKIGFDPAQNLAAFSRELAEVVVSDFFTLESFREKSDLQGRRPRIVTSIAMFYDLEDPKKFVSDVKHVMHPDGLWIVQMSYLPLMLAQNAFDNICHEHLEYYSLHSLENLLKLYELDVVDVELNDVNGGSFRVYIRNGSADPTVFGDAQYRERATERVLSLRQEENSMNLTRIDTYQEFANRAEKIKSDLVSFIKNQVALGSRVFVYGASTKGNTLLQYFGLDHRLITAAVERNPDKWGKCTVGTRIPIISEEEGRCAKPDFFLILPWHFLESFRERENAYLAAGGRFIVPLPQFRLI